MSRFRESLDEALAVEAPEERIRAIKTNVAAGIRSADERVEVSFTDHFNHTFVPDIVLSWPGSNERRPVFLRASFRAWDLMRDIESLAQDRPILMPLEPIEETQASETPQLEELSREYRTLIADPYGMEAFEEETASAPVVSLLSHAMLQGGRGLFSSGRAHKISNELSAGFQGAQQANYDATRVALQSTSAALDSHRASQINQLLHAVWIGSGATPAGFPGVSGIRATVDAEALRFILEVPDLASDEFWLRLGHGLTTGRLAELGNLRATPNLQRLIRGALHRLSAKACRVVAADSDIDAAIWRVVEGTLALQTRHHAVYFAPRYVKDLDRIPEDSKPLSPRELRARADRGSIQVGEVTLSGDDATVSYGSDERPDVSQDSFLATVSQILPQAVVVSAVARLGSGGRTIRCNFNTGTAAGNSTARYYIAELVAVAVPLLASLNDDEITAIQDVATVQGDPSEDIRMEDDGSWIDSGTGRVWIDEEPQER